MSDSLPPHGLPPGSSVHGILQARILEWVTILFSRAIFLTQGSNCGLQHSWWPIIGLFLKRDPHWTWTWDQSLTPWGYSLLEGEREGVLLCDVERAFWHNYTSASLLSIPEHIHIETPIILSFEVHPGNCHCWYTGTLRCACYPCLHSPESSLSMHPWHHSTPCNKLQCPLILLFMIFKYWIFMETLQKMRRYFK